MVVDESGRNIRGVLTCADFINYIVDPNVSGVRVCVCVCVCVCATFQVRLGLAFYLNRLYCSGSGQEAAAGVCQRRLFDGFR